MRLALIFTLFFAIAFLNVQPLFAELTEQRVRQIIREELEPINKEIIAIKLDIAEMKGKIATKDNIIGVYAAILVTWVVTIAAIVTIPYLYGRADRERVKQLEADVRELIKLRSEVEVLKGIREAEERRRETARRIIEKKPEFEEAYKKVGLL